MRGTHDIPAVAIFPNRRPGRQHRQRRRGVERLGSIAEQDHPSVGSVLPPLVYKSFTASSRLLTCQFESVGVNPISLELYNAVAPTVTLTQVLILLILQ